jgi:hypothetical protein
MMALHEENERLQARTQALQIRVEQLSLRPPTGPAPHWGASATWVARDSLPWAAALLLVALLAWFLHWLNSDRESPWRGDADMARTRLRQALNRSRTVPERPPASPATSSPVAAALPSAPAALVTATVEHTLPDDVQAQADEFIQEGHLGAVAMLLETHLRTQAQKSAPVLLGLLDIYQEMGQTSQVTRVGTLMSQLFNLRPPTGGQDQDVGLERHPATLDCITAQWNQPSVREVLKNLLLRPTAIEELSLAAFRDVLALYEMAGLREADDADYGLDWE